MKYSDLGDYNATLQDITPTTSDYMRWYHVLSNQVDSMHFAPSVGMLQDFWVLIAEEGLSSVSFIAYINEVGKVNNLSGHITELEISNQTLFFLLSSPRNNEYQKLAIENIFNAVQ